MKNHNRWRHIDNKSISNHHISQAIQPTTFYEIFRHNMDIFILLYYVSFDRVCFHTAGDGSSGFHSISNRFLYTTTECDGILRTVPHSNSSFSSLFHSFYPNIMCVSLSLSICLACSLCMHVYGFIHASLR